MAEYWDLFDADRGATGQIMRRGDPYPPGGYHLVIHVCLFNAQGELLIQRRQPFKEGWPGLWDLSVGGSAVAGETGSQAARRELREELGYDADFTGILPLLSVSYNGGFDDYYALRTEVAPGALRLQPEEVCDAHWASRGEVLAMIEDGRFIPYYPSLIQLLFDKQTRYGAHTH